MQYLADSTLRLQLVKMQVARYLVFENGTFRGSIPMNKNDIFQLEPVGAGTYALRLVHYTQLLQQEKKAEEEEEEGMGSSSGSGSGSGSDAQEAAIDEVEIETPCFIGFPDADSKPRCYDSTESVATIFVIMHF